MLPKPNAANSPPLEGCPKGGVVGRDDKCSTGNHPLPPPEEGNVGQPPLFEGNSKRAHKRNSQNYFNLPYNQNLKERAKALRKAGNLSEILFWNEVKNKQFKGYDFDRQKIIGNYIVDFFCTNCNVVIEIDGSSHDNKAEYDAERDRFLESAGLKVIHIQAVDVLKDLRGVMLWLYQHPFLKN